MQTRSFPDSDIPYFCYDRKLTAGQIREQLGRANEAEWLRVASWIMREATPSDVWAFLKPSHVYQQLPKLEPLLHRRRDFWRYILTAWHELGKF